MRSLFGLIHVALVIWALFDLFGQHRDGCSSVIWFFVIIGIPWLGPIIYLAAGRESSVF